MAEETKVQIPEAPNFPGLPEAKRSEWRAAYAKGLKAALVNFPDDAIGQRQAATREANRILSVGEPENYAAAAALADWQVLSRQEDGAVLKIVTIDGRKYSYPVPRKAARGDEKKD